MFSSDDFGAIKELVSRLGLEKRESSGEKRDCQGKRDDQTNRSCVNLTPSQILIIAAFLTGVLEVNSVLVDKQQDIEIVLTGSLKRKTQSVQIMEGIGGVPFDQVIK
jgi:hypothetical protein